MTHTTLRMSREEQRFRGVTCCSDVECDVLTKSWRTPRAEPEHQSADDRAVLTHSYKKDRTRWSGDVRDPLEGKSRFRDRKSVV